MSRDEISEHCLCDKCAGHECGADDPEKRAADEKKVRDIRDTQMREEGAKAERERLLKIIHKYLKERYRVMEDAHTKQQYVITIAFIKSLRSSSPSEQEERK